MSLATPRILPAHLHAFAPDNRPAISTVRMLGKITAIHGDQATLESYENQTVTLIMNRDSHLSLHSYYEIVGKVINLEGGQGLGLRVLGVFDVPLGPNAQGPDLKLFAAVVDATFRYKALFFEDGNQSNGDYSAY